MDQLDQDPAAECWLFSYGTLQLPEVQLATFGRLLNGREDVLVGYALSMIEIADPLVIATSGSSRHPLVTRTDNPDDEVRGAVFKVSAAEISAADAYEVSDYIRVSVTLKSGIRAFAYASKSGTRSRYQVGAPNDREFIALIPAGHPYCSCVGNRVSPESSKWQAFDCVDQHYRRRRGRVEQNEHARRPSRHVRRITSGPCVASKRVGYASGSAILAAAISLM